MLAIILTGGGARGAFQAGFLKGLGELLDKDDSLMKPKIFYGLSAGAINATYCAIGCENLKRTTVQLCELWKNIEPNQVYRTDLPGVTKVGLKWIRDLSLGGLFQQKDTAALLDTRPLKEFLKANIDLRQLPNVLENKSLHSLVLSAYSYQTEVTNIFFQGSDVKFWNNYRRMGFATTISHDHIMASCAIPLIFPAIKIDNQFYGDGAFRNVAPVGPAINFNASKLLVVGVRQQVQSSSVPSNDDSNVQHPTAGRVAGLLLNSFFFDSTDIDVERIEQINQFLQVLTPKGLKEHPMKVTPIQWYKPSQNLGRLAEDFLSGLPKTIQFLLKGLGSQSDYRELASYLLFSKSYCSQLVDLGYSDFQENKDKVIRFLSN